MSIPITNKENPTLNQAAKEAGFTSKKSLFAVDQNSIDKVITNNHKTKRNSSLKGK